MQYYACNYDNLEVKFSQSIFDYLNGLIVFKDLLSKTSSEEDLNRAIQEFKEKKEIFYSMVASEYLRQTNTWYLDKYGLSDFTFLIVTEHYAYLASIQYQEHLYGYDLVITNMQGQCHLKN